MKYLNFLLVYAGPFIALGLIYLFLAYTAYRWEDKHPNYYRWVGRVNDWLPKIGAFVVIGGFVLYLFGAFE